jgi:bifunctional non-homologous end joining protein LigD
MARDSLSTYRAKRDFTKTSEPAGKVAAARGAGLRFVVQRHDATRLHYDFRLELDGVFKSWAVTRGPSRDPHDKRLAVETEDHPLDYGDFEGTIPQDEYGGGTVQLWDRGYWIPERDPHEGLRKGDLKFSLDGERLHGSWVLVRMKWDRTGGKRTNWLLIKHRDEAAHDGDRDKLLTGNPTSVASGRTLQEIALGKGRAPTPFMNKGQRNRARAVWHSKRNEEAQAGENGAKGGKANGKAGSPRARPARARKIARLPQFVEPQLATLVDRPPRGAGWAHEVKFDGYRLQLRVEDGEAVLRTRKGLDWTEKFRAIAQAAKALPDCIIDGEVCALDRKGAPDFSALQAAISEGNSKDLIFFAFDLLFANGEDLRPLPLADRKEALRKFLESTGSKDHAVRYVEHFETDGEQVLRSATRMHLEGIVSKELDAPYRSGRGSGWVKAKSRAGHEVVIGGWSQKGRKLRSLLVGVHRAQNGKARKLVYVGRVGTGFPESVMRIVLPKLRALESKASPFDPASAPRREPDVHWAQPELVAEIEFAGWTGDRNVRQAAFKGLREDKPAREVVAERPAEANETEGAQPTSKAAALRKKKNGATGRSHGPRASRLAHDSDARLETRGPSRSRGKSSNGKAGSDDNVVMGVTISHPDKTMWPGEKPPVSKLELAQYLETVGVWMMEHLKGRPCSLVRTPDGIDGQHFFQRHTMPGMSDLIEGVRVRGGDKKPYIQIDRVEGLIAAAQMGATEFHPWNSQPDVPELPGRLVFDLDPAPDVAFDDVVRGAREISSRLQKLGLVTFCKTTGGKGLHVVVPLTSDKRSPDWDTAKTFAKEICRRVVAREPDSYVLNMAKQERKGRIFLDYLRNDRTSTAVAPLSPRARAGATVSMPLEWNQVKSGLDPKRFTMRTAPALLKKTKPWRDYAKSARPLRAAIEALIESKW